jgi:hypothetical protein
MRGDRNEKSEKSCFGTLNRCFTVWCSVGCRSGADSKKEIVLLEGMFAEIDYSNYSMAAILIEKNTDLTVKFHDSMATVPASQALRSKGLIFM